MSSSTIFLPRLRKPTRSLRLVFWRGFLVPSLRVSQGGEGQRKVGSDIPCGFPSGAHEAEALWSGIYLERRYAQLMYLLGVPYG
jgi:hypothetical protein